MQRVRARSPVGTAARASRRWSSATALGRSSASASSPARRCPTPVDWSPLVRSRTTARRRSAAWSSTSTPTARARHRRRRLLADVAQPDVDITGGPSGTVAVGRRDVHVRRQPGPDDVLLQARRRAVGAVHARRRPTPGSPTGAHTFTRDRARPLGRSTTRARPSGRGRVAPVADRDGDGILDGRGQLPGRRERGPGRRGQGRRRRRLRGAPVRHDAGRGRQGRDGEAARRRGVRQAAARRDARARSRPACARRSRAAGSCR